MKILHLEDNPADAGLVRDLLEAEWPDLTIEVVDDREAFTARLREDPDIVLSDFALASFDGLEALRVAQSVRPETPFIFVSGSIGEDRAIEAVRKGANDYILKDRMMRLPVSIRRALQETRERGEKKRMEEQLLRVQRLETIGQLAAGIAHDLNNVLAPISLGVPILRQQTSNPVGLKLLAAFEKSAERGTALVRQMLAFARGAGGEHRLVNVEEIARDLLVVLQGSMPKSIAIEPRIGAELWPVMANPTQVHQVLLNLCVNARDAMPAGGSLRLTLENVVVAPAAADAPALPPGRYLRLEVADTGTGIAPEILDKIWEPFFTTKQAAQGTGLGLATVRGIVENHHGAVQVRSAPGQGTAFAVYLPAHSP